MPEAKKLTTIIGLLAKAETVYGTPVALVAASDGVQLAEPAQMTINYAYDGARPAPPGNLATQRRAAPSGRTASGSFMIEAKGAGATYSALVVPPNVHAMLQAAGLTATGSFGVGVEKWTYAPNSAVSGQTSLSLEAYARGEKWNMAGAYTGFRFKIDSGKPPVFEFPFNAILNGYADDVATPPTIVYPAPTVDPPKAENIQLVLGNYLAAVVRSLDWDLTRSIDNPRLNLNAPGGHAGFAPGKRGPLLKVVIEATPLQLTPFHAVAGLDPYNLVLPAAGAPQNILASLQIGATQYNRYKLNLPQVQVMSVVPQEDGPTALWELTLDPYASTPIANDDFTLVFD